MKFLLISFLIIDAILHCVVAVTGPAPLSFKPGNFQNPEDRDDLEDALLLDMWDAEKPTLSKRAQECRELIKKLRESDNGDFEEWSLAVSEFSWMYVPIMCTQPDFTPYKNVLDAWAKHKEAEDCLCECPDLVKALRAAKPAIRKAMKLSLESAAFRSGCSKDDPCKTKKKQDYEVTEYEPCNFWDTTGWIYPCKIQECAKDLADSSRKVNNMMSLMFATFSIPPMLEFEEKLDFEFKYELFSVIGADFNTNPIAADQCEGFLAIIKDLEGRIKENVRKAMRKALVSTECPLDPQADED